MFEYKITHAELFPDHVTRVCNSRVVRHATRAALFDEYSNVALVMENQSGFYFLPGGGIESGESTEESLERECAEEAGCSIKIIKKLGSITAEREDDCRTRVNYCYEAQVISKGVPTEKMSKVIFVKKEKALDVLREQFQRATPEIPNFYARKFNTKRDILILESLS